MKILGIDPGTIAMGYGVIDSDNDNVTLIACGALNTPKRSLIGERLNFLYNELHKLVATYQPDEVAIEEPFVSRNVKSAFAIGRAQAVAILVAANRGIPCYEYTPAQIKQRVANYGTSSKEQIQEMVRLQLGLQEVPEPADAADALAVALCHVSELRINRMLSQQ